MHVVLTRRATLDVPDGINIFVFSLSEALLMMGHSVTVVASSVVDMSNIPHFYRMRAYPRLLCLRTGVQPKESPGRDLGSRPAVYHARAATDFFRNRQMIADLKPDLVIVNGTLPFRLPGKTCVVSHDLEQRVTRWSFPRHVYKRFCYSRADRIVATTTEIRAGLAAELSIGQGDIHVIPTCLDLSAYRPRPYDQRTNTVLHIGTIGYKNPLASVHALSALPTNDVELLITGEPTAQLTRHLAAIDPDISRRVHVLGFVSATHLRELLSTAKLVSVPSRYDFPVASPTVIESFASGTPVVGSTSISRDLLRHEMNGYSPSELSSGSLAHYWTRLLTDERVWKTLSRGALSTAQRFSSGTVANAYLALSHK